MRAEEEEKTVKEEERPGEDKNTSVLYNEGRRNVLEL